MVIEQEFGRFNVYDIFSTFLPGSILLIGLAAPFTGLNALFADLSVGGILILIILSFGGGLGIQAIASFISSASSGFAEHMNNVLPEEEDAGESVDDDAIIKVSSIDYDFY